MTDDKLVQPPITFHLSPFTFHRVRYRPTQPQSLLDSPMGFHPVSRRLPKAWDYQRRSLARQDKSRGLGESSSTNPRIGPQRFQPLSWRLLSLFVRSGATQKDCLQ